MRTSLMRWRALLVRVVIFMRSNYFSALKKHLYLGLLAHFFVRFLCGMESAITHSACIRLFRKSTKN